MASGPEGDARLAGLDEELRRLRGRLEALRQGLPSAAPTPAAPAPQPQPPQVAPAAGPAAEDEVMARLRGLLDELKTLTGEPPPP